ncbi:hypothetical protein DBT_0009 [Dissulfuribacter thermophilus]|uniref:Uncharacterized protein n=1 Tax=Dissulfuribacter thermophilus TaxID=1156395 RepID=A0A1B9F8F3_9BACT|nr:amphi-Trp domain-containing protein [Dissulfuribacter thermophilus]OCC16192.1 hypothetical protein DBT_0009 [Dissulfuribacter thermophilus]
MKLVKKARFTREEMAEYLSRLSQMIANGILEFETGPEKIEELVSFVLEVKRKKGSLELELSFKSKIPDEKEGKIEGKLERYANKKKSASKRYRPYRAKLLKKTLAAVWKEFKRSSTNGEIVDSDLMDQLRGLLAQYDEFVEAEWKEQWVACKNAVEKALNAAKTQDNDAIKASVSQVDDLIKACHKAYK